MRTRSAALTARLEELYTRWHRPEEIQSDPLQWVRRFADPADREIAGLVAATVAFGRVAHIDQSVARALMPMGERPSVWLRAASDAVLRARFAGWRHRWATDAELCSLLRAVADIRRAYGSLGAAWGACMRADDRDAHDTLIRWVGLFDERGIERDHALLPRPARASACKRLHLFLRWMIRCDAVDPGGWPDSPARLLVPLDVHMHRIARAIGFTRRRTADLRTAREVTARFRRLAPDDPVRYDFALTRLGIQQRLTGRQIKVLFADPPRTHADVDTQEALC